MAIVIMDNLQAAHSTITKNIPIDVLIGYSEQGLSTPEIGKLVGCSTNNIYQRFQQIEYTPKYLQTYKAKRADILAQKQRELLNSIGVDDIKSMAPRDRFVAYGILYDKEQQERRGISERNIEDDTINDLSAQFGRIARQAPIVINNILNIVGQLPQDIRDRVSKMIPSSLTAPNITDCEVSA
jgi:hypothetical protein